MRTIALGRPAQGEVQHRPALMSHIAGECLPQKLPSPSAGTPLSQVTVLLLLPIPPACVPSQVTLYLFGTPQPIWLVGGDSLLLFQGV